MYKPIDKLQHSFLDFNQPMGLHMNPDNRWIKLADQIPWDEFEVKYAKLFPSDTGNVAKPLLYEFLHFKQQNTEIQELWCCKP